MNIAAIIALLLSSGACAPTDFHGSDGSTLRVVVCPMTVPAAPEAGPDEPPPVSKRSSGTDVPGTRT